MRNLESLEPVPMQRARLVLIGVCLTSLSGCGLLGYAVKHQSTVLIAAEPLDSKEVQAVFAANDPASQFAAIGVVINDSFAKCEQFTNGLVMIENTTNTGFDMTTTLLSALATAFRPLSTVHGL